MTNLKKRMMALSMILAIGVTGTMGCGNGGTKDSEVKSTTEAVTDKADAAKEASEVVTDETKAVNESSEASGETAEVKEGVISDEEATLKIYAQYADDDTKIPFDYAKKQLAIAYPNVTLELDIEAQDDGQKLQTYAATGNLPDIFRVELAQIEAFKKSGNVMVLNDIADQTGFTEKVYDSCKNILYHDDGNIYAFPYAGNEVVLWYYNKEIFAQHNLEVPKTYEELKNVIRVLKENDIIPMTIFAKEKWITTALYDAIATRYDVGGIDKLDKQNGSITDDAYVKAANTMHNLVQEGLLPSGVTSMNYDQAASLFYEGKAAMFMNGQWEIEMATDAMGDQVDWMYYPAEDEAAYEACKTAWSGGGSPSGFAVNPKSEHADLAAKVAAFISEKFCEAKYMYRSNPLIAVKVDVKPEKALTPMMQKLADVLPDTTSNTKFDWGLTNSIFKTGIEDQSQFLCTDQYTAEEFISEMTAVMERMGQE